MAAFQRYVGIDYSGAGTPSARLPGLRVYTATRQDVPREELPSKSAGKYWTRRGIALWLEMLLAEDIPAIVGIDHGFSFPVAYFNAHGLPHDWPSFLDDFVRHWPTDRDNTYVDFIREGIDGAGAERMGNTRWRRLTELRTGSAKSVFHFDVPGSVAKSTHAGLPWLRFLRNQVRPAPHIWPFDGWVIPAGRSAIVEVYPRLWSVGFPAEGRNGDQHDAYAVARWLRDADRDGRLVEAFQGPSGVADRTVAACEGWILGVR